MGMMNESFAVNYSVCLVLELVSERLSASAATGGRVARLSNDDNKYLLYSLLMSETLQK